MLANRKRDMRVSLCAACLAVHGQNDLVDAAKPTEQRAQLCGESNEQARLEYTRSKKYQLANPR